MLQKKYDKYKKKCLCFANYAASTTHIYIFFFAKILRFEEREKASQIMRISCILRFHAT